MDVLLEKRRDMYCEQQQLILNINTVSVKITRQNTRQTRRPKIH